MKEIENLFFFAVFELSSLIIIVFEQVSRKLKLENNLEKFKMATGNILKFIDLNI